MYLQGGESRGSKKNQRGRLHSIPSQGFLHRLLSSLNHLRPSSWVVWSVLGSYFQMPLGWIE
jgi:hypothetical protein